MSKVKADGTPKVNAVCHCRTPRGPVKEGRFVKAHETHNGLWWEFRAKGVENWRSRPASVTVVE